MRDRLREAWTLLETVTPLKADCGQVCGGRCCRPDGDHIGMRLFPGEERLLPERGYTLRPAAGGSLYTCEGICDRACRPLACRMFPLFPYVTKEGRVRAVFDPRGFRVCPLVRQSAHVPLERAFVRAVRRAGRILMGDDACRAFLEENSREIEELWRFLPPDRGRPPICRRPLYTDIHISGKERTE